MLVIQSALRQMVYLSIKELANTAEDIIMVTSSIQKDTQPNLEVIYRPNAIRALCRIIDASRIFSPNYNVLVILKCNLIYFILAVNGPGRGTVLQDRYSRQESVHLVCSSCLRLSPLPRGQGCHKTMGQRSPGSCQY